MSKTQSIQINITRKYIYYFWIIKLVMTSNNKRIRIILKFWTRNLNGLSEISYFSSSFKLIITIIVVNGSKYSN